MTEPVVPPVRGPSESERPGKRTVLRRAPRPQHGPFWAAVSSSRSCSAPRRTRSASSARSSTRRCSAAFTAGSARCRSVSFGGSPTTGLAAVRKYAARASTARRSRPVTSVRPQRPALDETDEVPGGSDRRRDQHDGDVETVTALALAGRHQQTPQGDPRPGRYLTGQGTPDERPADRHGRADGVADRDSRRSQSQQPSDPGELRRRRGRIRHRHDRRSATATGIRPNPIPLVAPLHNTSTSTTLRLTNDDGVDEAPSDQTEMAQTLP